MASGYAVVVGLVGVVVLGLGAGVESGRLWLLANYDPDAVGSERRVARLTGGALTTFALLTFGLVWGLQRWLAGDWWWAGWAVVALGVAFGVASVASSRL